MIPSDDENEGDAYLKRVKAEGRAAQEEGGDDEDDDDESGLYGSRLRCLSFRFSDLDMLSNIMYCTNTLKN